MKRWERECVLIQTWTGRCELNRPHSGHGSVGEQVCFGVNLITEGLSRCDAGEHHVLIDTVRPASSTFLLLPPLPCLHHSLQALLHPNKDVDRLHQLSLRLSITTACKCQPPRCLISGWNLTGCLRFFCLRPSLRYLIRKCRPVVLTRPSRCRRRGQLLQQCRWHRDVIRPRKGHHLGHAR